MKAISKLIKNKKSLWKVYSNVGYAYNYILSYFFPIAASKKQFKASFGRDLNLENPTTLNEKLMYLKLRKYWNNPRIADCADKYAVRDFIEKSGCGETLTKLYGVWEKVSDIDWGSLPNRFAIKCNHGSGYNLICTDKKTFDMKKAAKQLDKWMHERYGVKYTEQGIYDKISRKIIAEEFIETSDGLPPKDYKFFCSYGKVYFLFVASDRINGQTKFDYYYPDWTYIPVKNYFPNNGPIDRSEKLDDMIRYAERLSNHFPLVRVDFYNEGNHIYFGELTFTHFGCLNCFEPDKYDYEFGSYFPNVVELQKCKI